MFVSVSTMPAGKNAKDYALQIDDFADFLHCDVCDGLYNSTICFSPEMAKEINDNTTIPLDVHLMTKNLVKNAKKFIQSGANIVTAQFESFENADDVKAFIDCVKKEKTLVGLAIEPETEIDQILPYLPDLDVVLLMSVNTGKSGQKFNDIVLEKIDKLNALKKECNFKIEVDGGIDGKIAMLLKDKGVDMVVSGSYVYNQTDKKYAIDCLR